jgi:F-type H+-transporting ATPase subunit b
MELLIPDTGLLIFQVVAFTILLIVLRKFAWKPILDGLNEREQTIESALLAAEQAKNDMQTLQADNQSLLAEARTERDHLLKEALAVANSIKEEAREETSKIASKMIEEAALADVKNQVAMLSLEITEKLLRKELADQKGQRDLIDRYVKDLNLN